jgi:thiamine-phosphate diphosphorylase
VIVLITDRRYDVVPMIAAIVNAGIPISVQVRDKDLDGGALLAFARDVVAAAAGAPVWINDRVDIAMILGLGVHLPENGMPIADVRRLTKTNIGASRHSAEAAAACEADVVQLGPIFDTPGKRAIGVAALRGARAGTIAVGGIDSPERASLAAAAGADGIAVIRAAWSAADPIGAVRGLLDGFRFGRASR